MVFPVFPIGSQRIRLDGRILENIDESSIHKKERSIAQSTSPKSPRAKNEMAPNIGEGQQQGQKNMPSSQNVDDQPRDQQTTIRETLQELSVNINKLDTTVTKYRKLHPNLSKKTCHRRQK
uniref:Uncharacterized protein n=1 Tax=Magallana gigas TaxID=29159 RepID=K1P0L2_MAGGI